MDYKEITKRILTENGIYPFDALEDEPLECDSLTFISIVVSIENELGKEVPDYLLVEYPKTYNEWVEFIKNINEEQFKDEEDEDY